ncbi:hypothetical protein GCM10010218_56680 [Streptomyces mashuensis]|uniref:DUF4142 domain-containing protein n=1 Tax=Streptomyces mashuensis TaxID=33904 RepID=A0A919B994_9ACTN|nr:DUF4142 domain-containing protein [Streptomyces mashuensis]GHF67836.1 hypothetical protein GCM10010218_56680 [Streptomyces mashuensis]
MRVRAAHGVRRWPAGSLPRWAVPDGGRPGAGRALGTWLVVAALAATLVALIVPVALFPGRAAGGARPVAAGAPVWDDDGAGVRDTPYGELTALDRDFVRKVRLAGLWEQPAGRLAQERGTTESVRTAGEHLVGGHTELDRRSVEAARVLDVPLPDRPTAQQQGWLDRIGAAQGSAFDRTFAELVRAAHGKVFGLVALVRDRTGNAVVRDLATRANTVVLDHISVLEDTGRSGVPHTGAPGGAPARHSDEEMK